MPEDNTPENDVNTAEAAENAPESTTTEEAAESQDSETIQDSEAMLKQQFAEAEARAAILASGGDVEVLMPHLRQTMQVDETSSGFTATCKSDDGAVSLNDYLEQLKTKQGFASAFASTAETSESSEAVASATGSGATAHASGSTVSVDRNDPLAIGSVLTDVASGKVTVSL